LEQGVRSAQEVGGEEWIVSLRGWEQTWHLVETPEDWGWPFQRKTWRLWEWTLQISTYRVSHWPRVFIWGHLFQGCSRLILGDIALPWWSILAPGGSYQLFLRLYTVIHPLSPCPPHLLGSDVHHWLATLCRVQFHVVFSYRWFLTESWAFVQC
jgi:hypothetical protein